MWIVVVLSACQRVPDFAVQIHECACPPEGRACASSFAWQEMVYVFGGRLSNGEYSNTLMRYNVTTEQWDSGIATPLVARVNGVVCTNRAAVYVGLGYANGGIYQENAYLRDWWRYEPEANRWTRLADFPSAKTVAAVAWADAEYVWVGFGFNGFGDELWRYKVETDEWEAVEHQSVWPKRLMSSVAVQVNGRYFHGTGFRRQGQNDWWEFIAADSHWERRASLPGAGRHNAAAAATEKACWVIGGWHYGDPQSNGYYFADILRYAPEADEWSVCGSVPCGAIENAAACAIGNSLYFGLGESNEGEVYKKWYRIED